MRGKVLIVEDSTTMRDQLRRALVPAGYEVIDARDGVEGIEMVKRHPDLVLLICDVNMPRMDGITMIETLRAEGPMAPILMLTTEGQPELIQKAKAAGARGWIIKPFDPRLLVKAVSSLARPL